MNKTLQHALGYILIAVLAGLALIGFPLLLGIPIGQILENLKTAAIALGVGVTFCVLITIILICLV